MEERGALLTQILHITSQIITETLNFASFPSSQHYGCVWLPHGYGAGISLQFRDGSHSVPFSALNLQEFLAYCTGVWFQKLLRGQHRDVN